MAGLDGITGAAFPFRVDPATGGVATTRDDAKILQNVRILLATRLGERPMEREYGTRIPGLVQDPNDDATVDLAVLQARQAILRWEPRVIPSQITVGRDPDDGQVNLRLALTATNEQRGAYLTVPLV
ncbi:MAG: GPW/gp25 family protein [Acidimicrobiia bacterium]